MSRGREQAAVPATVPLEPVDPRVEQMRCLVELDVLGEEWDAGQSVSARRSVASATATAKDVWMRPLRLRMIA